MRIDQKYLSGENKMAILEPISVFFIVLTGFASLMRLKLLSHF